MRRMIFLPGMRPGTVSGAAGASGRRRGAKLVSGPAYRGVATPTNIIPYEEPRPDNGRKARLAAEDRKRDVADALHFHRDSPKSAQERLRDVRAAAAEVAI